MGRRIADDSAEDAAPEYNYSETKSTRVKPSRVIDEATLQGSEWARNDADICRKYDGQWVVACGREIVCAGYDMNQVGEEAAKKLNRPKESIVVAAIVSPDRLFANW